MKRQSEIFNEILREISGGGVYEESCAFYHNSEWVLNSSSLEYIAQYSGGSIHVNCLRDLPTGDDGCTDHPHTYTPWAEMNGFPVGSILHDGLFFRQFFVDNEVYHWGAGVSRWCPKEVQARIDERRKKNKECLEKLQKDEVILAKVLGRRDRYKAYGMAFEVPKEPVLQALMQSETRFLETLEGDYQIELSMAHIKMTIPVRRFDEKENKYKMDHCFTFRRRVTSADTVLHTLYDAKIPSLEDEQKAFEREFSIVKKHEPDIAEVVRHLEELKFRKMMD